MLGNPPSTTSQSIHRTAIILIASLPSPFASGAGRNLTRPVLRKPISCLPVGIISY
jgi:hypothetical protein